MHLIPITAGQTQNVPLFKCIIFDTLPTARHRCSHDVHAQDGERAERIAAQGGVRRRRRPLLGRVGGHREEARLGHLLSAREGV